ncbi:MAG TPA: SDR family oxidoreductase [Flavobacterium sp.]|jgi:enoyl-[acyl-carrier protein] reductase I
MVSEFSGNWAIILGGSSGLGLATANKLAKHGMNICIIHRNSRAETAVIETEFDSIKSLGVKFRSYNADALNRQKREEIIADLQSITTDGESVRCLIHSIAKGSLKPMASAEDVLSSEDFTITLNAMAVSLYDWTASVFSAGLFSDDSRIISFTSEGSTKAWRNYAAVSSAKAALEAISRSIALEFAKYGIRSNCVQAGVTDTSSLRRIPDSDNIIEATVRRNPFRRLTTPEDVANVVYLLCKDEASWINGTIVKADGGESLQ